MNLATDKERLTSTVSKKIKPAPPRSRYQVGKYLVKRSARCISCGLCARLCPHGVHIKFDGFKFTSSPMSYKCIGADCADKDYYCVPQCPVQAVSVVRNPTFDTMGDPRWTADLIVSNWDQAENGRRTNPSLEYKIGDSGGGFDRLEFVFPDTPPARVDPEEVSLKIPLNRRDDDNRPEVGIDLPGYGGGMSFGSVSVSTMKAKAMAATVWNTFTCTGEGGYPDLLIPFKDHVITQMATGLFGVREETIKRARIVEFKYAQGAKPGLGGHLLGDKNTPEVARIREAVQGSALFSPFPFHSVYSVEDHKKHLDWIGRVNPDALLSVKVSTPTDVDMVAVGSYYAGAHILHLDGSYGGTGAAPDIAKKNIAMPIEYAIPKVHQFLVDEGIRDKITVIASGGLRTAWDIAKAVALGADGVVWGTAEMAALGCVRCGNCESGRGCARGIASTDRELAGQYDSNWGAQRIINLYAAWHHELTGILVRFGMSDIAELRGRTDLLRHLDYTNDK